MARPRYALITGCGEGSIGEALTLELLDRDYEVIATLLPNEPREHLVQRPKCHVYDLDVTSDNSVQNLLVSVEKLTGGFLDVLGNNAGITYQMPAVDFEMALVEKLIAVNVVGPMRIVKYLYPLLVRAKGIIFNSASAAAFFPVVYSVAYCASKAALYQYGQILRVELAPLGVRVINIIAGEVSTNILKGDTGRQIPEGSVYSPMAKHFEEYLKHENTRMPPQEFAQGVVHHILGNNPSPRYWRGTQSTAVKILHRFFPPAIYDMIAYRMYHLKDLTAKS